jgi:hypothetical protein
VQEISDPQILRQVAVLLERENATLHAKLLALAEELARRVATRCRRRSTSWPS